MDKIKVTFIYPADILGIKIGGPETFIRSFIKYAPQEFDIDFYGISADKEELPVGKWTKISVGQRQVNFFALLFEKEPNKKRIIPLSLRFTLALKSYPVSVNQGAVIFNRIEPAFFFKKSGALKICVIHSDVNMQLKKKESEVLWRRLPFAYRKLEANIFKNMDYIFTVIGSTLDYYQARYPDMQKKFSFLPTWADTGIFYPEDTPALFVRQQLKPSFGEIIPEGKWILFVGRLQEVKAPLRLLEAFSDYLKLQGHANLVIIGEGNLKESMQEFSRKMNIQESVFFVGSVSQELLAKFYRASDALLLSSNFEGMPRCVLEALSSGLPVVATDVGEVKRVVKNGFSGEVVDGFSPSGLAKGLKRVIDNPYVYTKRNCVSSVTDYTPEKVLSTVYEIIRSRGK
ncbi:MAG: glycosyltransferase family 4 protein [Candidatus Omnitrophota bacterium]